MNSGGPQTTSFRNRTPLYHEGKGPDKSYSSYLWRGIESHDDARTHEDIENHDDARTVERQRCLCFHLYTCFFSVFFFCFFFLTRIGGSFFNQVNFFGRSAFFFCFSFQKEVVPCRKKSLSLPVFLVWFDGRTFDVCLWTFGVSVFYCVLQIWGFPKMGDSPKTRVSMIKN
jgi:hypothetical protein